MMCVCCSHRLVAGQWKLFRRAGFTFQHSRFLSERTITLFFHVLFAAESGRPTLAILRYSTRNITITLMDTYTRRGNGNIISPKKNLKGVNCLV